MKMKMPTICYVNISEKARQLTTSIYHIEKYAILFLLKLATTDFWNPFQSMH